MSQRGHVIDGGEFARSGGFLDGLLDVAACPRLGEVLADAGAAVSYSLRGEVRSGGDLFLVLRIDGELRLRCQRCLGALEFPLQLTSRLRLVPPGAPWPDTDLSDDAYDAIALEQALDVSSLVEEEIVLALPLAPRHDVCAAPMTASAAPARLPLGALAELKRRGRRSEDC